MSTQYLKLLVFAVLIILVIIITSCASKKGASESAESIQLYFGNGGGFAGITKEYRLHPSGVVQYKAGIESAWVDYNTVSEALATQLFSQVEQFDLLSINHDQPGNRYYFIEVVKGEQRNKIMWGSPNDELKKEVLTFYKILADCTKIKR